MPKEDVVFKRLFGSLGSEKILKGLLEAVLDVKLNSVTLDFNQEYLPENLEEGRKNVLDVIAELENGTKINVEMQSNINSKIGKRVLLYWSRIYASQAKKGDKELKTVHKTIGVWIIDKGIVQKSGKDYHTIIKARNKNGEECDVLDDFEIHFLELQKLRKYGTITPRKLDFWMWFIDHTNEELIEMGQRSYEEIREAVEKLKELQADPIVSQIAFQEEMAEIDRAIDLADAKERAMKQGIRQGKKRGMQEGIKEGRKEGRKEGIKEGIKEGERNKQFEIAKNLKAKGMDITAISEVTGLSIEEVERI